MGAIKFYTILPWGTIIMCATINFLQNLPQGTVIRAVLLLGSEEYLYDESNCGAALQAVRGSCVF